MNKFEANISLLAITFFASVQYAFLAWVPDSVPHFAFLCITNLLGFLMSLMFFFGELFRLDFRQVKQSMILSAELIVFNLFLIVGVAKFGSTLTDAFMSMDFIFISVIMFLVYRSIPARETIYGAVLVFIGLYLMTDAQYSKLLNWNVVYLLISEIAFSSYIITIGAFSASSNPSIIAMGQMFFCFLFSLFLWGAEVYVKGLPFTLPNDVAFWGSVIYVSFFIRGLYTVIQTYAQRYITPLNTSLVFSTEVVMTTLTSPIFARFLGTAADVITLPKIIASLLIVLGVITAEPAFFGAVKRLFVRAKFDVREDSKLLLLSCLAYFLLDAPVTMTGILPSFVGIKNFVPFTLGLFFGVWGVLGCVMGCVLSGILLNIPALSILYECYCISVTGLGMYYGWYFLARKGIAFKQWQDYVKYIALLAGLSALCLNITVSAAYFIVGIFVGLPVNILFSSLLYIEPVMPGVLSRSYDAEFCILPGAESLEGANEVLEASAMKRGITMKRLLEIQSCIEELTIRILKAHPDARISAAVQFGDAISIRLHYSGEKYNPFRTEKSEDEIDIMSLKIIKHRAIRASYSYSGGVNKVHTVV